MTPRYPIFVISKGRWESRLTVKSLEWMGLDFRLVIEPQEYEQYAAVVDPRKIITTPFSNLGQGSIPVRNFVWEIAKKQNAERHWVLDDNIRGFWRLNRNSKIPIRTGTCFRAIEDFSDRFEDVALSGMHYYMFAPRKCKMPPFNFNRRIYSCILIKTDLPYRWRGRYNEDTDLSLRALKDGWCTVLFAAFLAQKMTTMLMKGGNTDELYKDDGRLRMAEALVALHPDVSKITWKWGRWQHQVDYSSFERRRPRIKPNAMIADSGYPMELRSLNGIKMLSEKIEMEPR